MTEEKKKKDYVFTPKSKVVTEIPKYEFPGYIQQSERFGELSPEEIREEEKKLYYGFESAKDLQFTKEVFYDIYRVTTTIRSGEELFWLFHLLLSPRALKKLAESFVIICYLFEGNKFKEIKQNLDSIGKNKVYELQRKLFLNMTAARAISRLYKFLEQNNETLCNAEYRKRK